jgi:hypothetical protein
MDEGRLAQTLRANSGDNGKIYVRVKPFGHQLDELWVMTVRCGRYSPYIVEIVDEAKLLASVLSVTTARSRLGINMSGRRGRLQRT